jgi:hypothetical protein
MDQRYKANPKNSRILKISLSMERAPFWKYINKEADHAA